ncbi:hypothetical protein GGF46_001260 [Coemansia sp. RSA 552]|nr:hypothetical protein GGF46_001260 [Coemansia sp. RSA 552]
MALGAIKHVLITGFQPFGTPRPADNRSWEAAKQLAGERMAVGDSAVVECHCVELPVSYSDVAQQMQQLHKDRRYSIAVHCGAGVAGVVRLEQRAHRSGYTRPGNKGAADLPPGGQVPGYDLADELWTAVDVDAVRRDLVGRGWSAARTNSDAGRYVCEFTYYCALAEAAAYEAGAAPRTLFVHVPPQEGDPYSDAQLAELIRDVIRTVARLEGSGS